MKKICIILIIMLLSGCAKLPEQIDINKNISDMKLTDEDTEKRYRDLETVWNNMGLNYRYSNEVYFPNISKEELELYKEELKNRIPNIKSDMEFYCELQTLVAKLGDAHTTMTFDDRSQVYYIPIEIFKIEDKYIITGIYEGLEKYLGYELIGINNVSVEEMYAKFSNFISYENEYWFDYRFTTNINRADFLEYFDIVENKENIVNLSVRNIESKGIENFNLETILNVNFISDKFKYIVSLEERKRTEYDSYELNDNSYLIELIYCRPNEGYNIVEFQNKVFSDIEKNKYNKIIIDLRENIGGLSSTFEELIDGLKKMQILYDFEIYTLIGNATFSSGVATAVYINNNLKSTFFGNPTGGKPNSFGAPINIKLESPFTFRIALKYYRFVDYDDMMAIYPDITIKRTYEDYINKIDTIVEAVLLRE